MVANIDTGVQFDHPALVGKYRGNLGGGTFDHNYNWYDPSGVCGSPSLAPCDNNGHGTHTMGTMVGDDGAGNQIGVAPAPGGSPPRAARATPAPTPALLAAGQWIARARPTSPGEPAPGPAPAHREQLVGRRPGSDPWYQATVQAWVAAGIFPAFSNGNSGPGCGTAGSPGDYAERYASGAFDINGAIATFSSRGPAATAASSRTSPRPA